jgi:radical SAM superfamily enzyme YgiQ (UPF0313 family)
VRITFIEPAAPGFHVYSFVKQLRLGLPLLGAIMAERGHQVRVYAESLSEVDWDDVLSSDLVGISSTTSTAVRAYRYARRVRDAGVPVVMGGPHVTFLADEAMDFCDYVVRNEGEETLVELVDYLHGRGSLDTILGLTYRDGRGQVVHNPSRPLLTSLTDLPWPDMSLVVGGEQVKPTPILASRGCPFGCEFCSVVLMFGRRVRTVEPVEVVKQIKKMEPGKLFFYDDNFFISKRRGKELLTEMIRQNAQVEFFAQIRVDSVCKDGKIDRELLDCCGAQAAPSSTWDWSRSTRRPSRSTTRNRAWTIWPEDWKHWRRKASRLTACSCSAPTPTPRNRCRTARISPLSTD